MPCCAQTLGLGTLALGRHVLAFGLDCRRLVLDQSHNVAVDALEEHQERIVLGHLGRKLFAVLPAIRLTIAQLHHFDKKY